jgi:RHS repeat-associated protein
MAGPEGEVVGYTYDQSNLLTNIGRFKGVASFPCLQIQYDAANRRKAMIFGNGVTESFTRDFKENITRLLFTRSDGSTAASFTYGYDVMNTRNAMSLDHLRVNASFTYDNAYRLIGETWSGNTVTAPYTNQFGSNIGNEGTYTPVGKGTPAVDACVSIPAHYQLYQYDAFGNRTQLDGSGRAATYDYNEENQLTTEHPLNVVSIGLSSAVADSRATGYSESVTIDGNIDDDTSTAKAWQSANQTGIHTVEATFTAGAKTVKQIRFFIPTGPGLAQKIKAQYWDGAAWQDCVIKAVAGATPDGTGYYKQQAHEIVFAISPVTVNKIRFYQASGGGAPATPNIAWLNEMQAYEYTTGVDINYFYDKNGNCTLRYQSNGTNQNIDQYAYDYANRLNLYKYGTGTVSGGVPTFATTTTHYTYLTDPVGNRFSKTNQLATGATIQEYRHAYDARDVVTDYEKPANGSLALVRSYVGGLDIDSKIARIDMYGGSELTPLFYLGDALATTTHLLNNVGDVTDTWVNNAWGEQIDFCGVNVERYGFQQREKDDENGTMNFRARFYDPRIGRFGGKDPIGNIFAHYAFCGNRPTDTDDPTGEQNRRPLKWNERDPREVEAEKERVLNAYYVAKATNDPNEMVKFERAAQSLNWTVVTGKYGFPQVEPYLVYVDRKAVLEAKIKWYFERCGEGALIMASIAGIAGLAASGPAGWAALAYIGIDTYSRVRGMDDPTNDFMHYGFVEHFGEENAETARAWTGLGVGFAGGMAKPTGNFIATRSVGKPPATTTGFTIGPEWEAGGEYLAAPETQVVPGRGMQNASVRSAVQRGNYFHYDQLNSNTATHSGGPSQLAQRYPNTSFRFARRGQAGPDVEFVGGTPPWEYPGSNWPEGMKYGDFKPDTPSGNSFPLPAGVHRLPYDPETLRLK